MEPVIQNDFPPGPNPALFSTFRRDIWPTKKKFEESMRKNPFFKSFDSRAMKKYLEFGVRSVPTKIYPVSGTAVTLTTTKHQETWSYVRANIFPLPPSPQDPQQRPIVPELDPAEEGKLISTRPEPMLALLDLPQLRPGVLWVYGATSLINTKIFRDEKLKLTGIGRGGSGGRKLQRVEERIVPACGHLVPLENVSGCAEIIVEWLGKQLSRFHQDEEFFRTHGRKVSAKNGLVVSKEWIKVVQMEADSKRRGKEKL